MNARLLGAAVAVVVAGGLFITAQSPTRPQAGGTDEAAIRRSSDQFATAFNKRDAKAVAALWTESGECRDADGEVFVGRAAIEKAYAESFKANPDGRIEVLVRSIRFPAKDLAVEEGLLRMSRGPKDLPATTAYVAIHAREGGEWKIALSAEAGAGLDRLEDLDWLLGEWTGKVKEDTISFRFVREAGKAAVNGTVTRTSQGKVPTSVTVRIAPDPETGQIRSWEFEDDGAHSQGLWTCDGKSWVIDSHGVRADGTLTAERILLQRVGADIITWRSIDRLFGDTEIEDAPPVRLTRSAPKR